jgi:DNA-binding transcriptional regulator YdaS (Cro superfamily)
MGQPRNRYPAPISKELSEKALAWLNSLPVETQRVFADRMETTTGQLRQVLHGNRPCNARIAIQIDKLTNGDISMVELTPDLDWDHVRFHLHRR